MIKEKRKLNMLKVRRCLIVFFAILLLIIGIVSLKINKEKNRYKDLTILLNNEFINLKNQPIIDADKNIFFSKEDIQNIFDNTLYYNEVEKELITTYNSHIALLKIDEEYAEINDETIELKGKMQEIDKKIYVPLTDLAIVYDLDIVYSQKSNRIIMDSILKNKVEASISKKTKVETKKGIFGKKIDKLIIGEVVVVLEKDGNYTKIRTPLGNIGYVKTKKLSNERTIREEKKQDKKDIKVYRNYSNISGIYDNIEVDETKLNVVVPTFFYLDKNSKVLDQTTSTTATYSIYKTWTDQNKLVILPKFTNNVTVSENLLSYSQRSSVINSLRKYLVQHNYMGINIEFSSIDDVNSFYRFILELVPRFKEVDLKVAITLNDNLDKSRLENVVDYILED